MTDKYLVSVGEARAFDDEGNLLFTGKTLLDTSLDIKVSNTDVRGGYGAPLLYVYYHSGDANFTITDAQWNLAYLAMQTGADVGTGKNVFIKETITVTGSAGSVSKTPLAAFGSTLYGWCELSDGTTERVTIAENKSFTLSGQASGTVYMYYYALDSAAKTFSVPSNIIPKIVRLVLDTQLATSEVGSNIIGKLQLDIPRASLTGNVQIAMKMDGVSSTPLNVRALADYTSGVGKFMDLSEVLTSANWYDDVISIGIVGGDFGLANGATKQLYVRAIPSTGAAFEPPAADITWASSDATKATVSAGGLVTWVAAGPTTIKASITSKNTIDANVVCTAAA